MSEPDWKDAPEWAQYAAMDSDGEWYWYENRPGHGREAWRPTGGRHEPVGVSGASWFDSLESRP